MFFMKRLGPGLLYAGAAVGVSHIVQSTSAGARYGWIMVVAVLLANILKYPFFEYGPRYAAATGTSLLHGYKKLGAVAPVVFFLFTIATMFIIEAAVTIVTAGLAMQIPGLQDVPVWIVSAAILLVCIAILYYGRYKFLSNLMKVIMVILAVTTLFTFVISFQADIYKPGPFEHFNITNETTLLFLISFIGWMPAPLDISVWHSVWSVSEQRESGSGTIGSALFDFKVGYWGTVILAILFVGLGTLMIYGSGKEMPAQAGAFADELINIYANVLGEWSRPFIAIAAFTTMFSTTITCLDAFPRVLVPNIQLIRNREESVSRTSMLLWLVIVAIGAIVILKYFTGSMGDLIVFITILSFLLAPVIALLNYLVVTRLLEPAVQPGIVLRILSWLGLIFMTGLGIYYMTTL